MSNPNEQHNTSQESSNQEEEEEEKQDLTDEQESQSNMDLLRTDSLVEGTPLAGHRTPQYDAFLQSLSNNINSYLSKHPQQVNPKSTGDSHKISNARSEKSSRIQRKRSTRVKRTKP